MNLENKTIGIAFTGSFCTFDTVISEIEKLARKGINFIPIFSENAGTLDTKFGKADDFVRRMEKITNNKPICNIVEAEPIGSKGFLDEMIIAPCTGNTIAKLASGITDTTVTMAAKANLRNQKPLVIAVSSNDALGANAKNIGILLNTKNVFFVPFSQDAPKIKMNSIVADMTQIEQTLISALSFQQLQPVII